MKNESGQILNQPFGIKGNGSSAPPRYRMPLGKRLFDIAASSCALLLLSPLLIVIAILIRVSSKGPIVYKSKRVGTGYQIFDFYKFRSMRPDADQIIKQMAHLNMYAKESSTKPKDEKCADCIANGTECVAELFTDDGIVCERLLKEANANNGSTFIKIKDDPRVTRVGHFIRNTSIDELPQLFNVLIGDMSIVGNRPLPLYEAEKITTDQFALRYMAPAGITGLWQVTKRGRAAEMSEEERIALDNEYAKNVSFVNDIRIILKTFPSLLQKENV